ncbi:hypothetical protein HMPREF0493_0567 [Lactobacillus amylolyticus DSM 11664]|uniref:Uncharacterized protein n=1 Tax=Lactobacillus amylolyticus DSM 11664 TaxID=585524 RepID=D4YST9_9LACO|nr:hypothetical protein HMPREF0493_0567 [Lactobacillus amylolyticus DSM 11664]
MKATFKMIRRTIAGQVAYFCNAMISKLQKLAAFFNAIIIANCNNKLNTFS